MTAATGQPRLSLRGVRKSFSRRDGTHFVAIDDLSLDIGQGEFLVLLGPSGCGKTTLLRCIAGLERASEGEIRIAGRSVMSSQRALFVPPEQRRIGMMWAIIGWLVSAVPLARNRSSRIFRLKLLDCDMLRR